MTCSNLPTTASCLRISDFGFQISNLESRISNLELGTSSFQLELRQPPQVKRGEKEIRLKDKKQYFAAAAH